jgi:hypothetical protein
MIALFAAALVSTATPAPTPPPLPLIYHSVTRPLCSSLADRIRPALGMMIDNDATIAKSVSYFEEYVKRATEGSDAGRDIAVLHLETLVTPLVNNTLAIQKMLEDPSVFPPVPRTADDATLTAIKEQMLKTLATQEAALDIINGFVTTQQLSQMQHEGLGYISALSAQGPGGQTNSAATQLTGPTPDPDHPNAYDDLALQAGLAPNPYEIDPTRIPGLALGYNPITALKEGVVWTQEQGRKAAEPLAKTVTDAAHSCGAPAASPSPNP